MGEILITEHKVGELYGGRIRLRACGLVYHQNKLLLALHKGIGPLGSLWLPPGGGVEFGETTTQAVARELWEECRIGAQVGAFYKMYEYIKPPLHAIELFYKVDSFTGQPTLGEDPEMGGILQKLAWMGLDEISTLPDGSTHAVVKDFLNEQ